MRILQVCPYSWSAFGGVQSHVRDLSSNLRSRGHDVLVLAAGPLSDSDRKWKSKSAQAQPTANDFFVQTIGRSRAVAFNGSVAPVCVQPRAIASVRRSIQTFRPDVVHVHEPMVPALSLAAMWFARGPVVTTFHAYRPASRTRTAFWLAARMFQPAFRRSRIDLAVSAAAASCTRPDVASRALVIPNGVDVERFSGSTSASLVPGRKMLFVGRLEPRKGFNVALRAFSRLSAEYPDLRLVVVGDGPCRSEVQRVQPDVRSRILMIGEVSEAALPSFYAASSVFVAPAIGFESFGAVLLEAMAAACPIVASDIDGYREVVRADIDALLIPPGDPLALALGVRAILDDPARAARLKESASARAQTFAWQRITTDIERAYEAVVHLHEPQCGRTACRKDATAGGVAHPRGTIEIATKRAIRD